MDKFDELKTILNGCFDEGTFLKAIISKHNRKASETEATPVKIETRSVKIAGANMIQFSSHMKDGKVLHSNLDPEFAANMIVENLKDGFLQCNIFNGNTDYQVMISKKGVATIIKKQNANSNKNIQSDQDFTEDSHNRKKNYIIPEGIPIAFLVKLGIMEANGNIKPTKRNKFTQINRYAQMLSDVVDVFPKDKTIRILDFGCGKSYLTFVLYYYFTLILNRQVEIIGLDLKKDVVTDCEAIARELGYDGLSFKVGDISDYVVNDSIDMVVSLHACDIATDAALERAVRAGAKVIFAVPCCQHELAKQLDCGRLGQITKQGILKQRLSEIATDALRASVLEICGYKVSVMEFIETEHTPKNLMIRAVKRSTKNPSIKKLTQEYYDTCSFLSAKPSLGERLKDLI